MSRIVLMVLTAALATSQQTAHAAAIPERIEFNRDIRPILSDNCFACHGPDENQRQAEYRLDIEEVAYREHDGVRAIVPGMPSESDLFRRITSTDDDLRMPPSESHQTLTKDQIELVRRWIKQGAVWQGHWSFISPKQPDVPKVNNPKWVTNPIDNFVLTRLEHEKLSPSPEANKTTLIRRVTFDLTGLPPTLAEIDAFRSEEHTSELQSH